MSAIDTVTDFLDSQEVNYEVLDHRQTFTAAAEARAAGTDPHATAKTLAVHDEAGYRLAVIPASERLDLHKLRELLGAGPALRLATEQELASNFDMVELGALPPFGSLVSAPEVVDRRLLDQERVACSAGDHRHSLLVDPNEIVRVAGAQVADICED